MSEKELYTIRNCDEDDILEVFRVLGAEQVVKELGLEGIPTRVSEKQQFFVKVGYFEINAWKREWLSF